jgi:hypothetical protein
MKPEKRWARYTQVGDVWINKDRYDKNIYRDTKGCDLWLGARHRQGYGFMSVLLSDGTRKMTVAHRVAMRIKLDREITRDEDVVHICGNPQCVRAEHLRLKCLQKEESDVG